MVVLASEIVLFIYGIDHEVLLLLMITQAWRRHPHFAQAAKRVYSNPPALPALEKLLTVVASASHVVDRSSKLLPRSPSHLAHQLQTFTNIKMYFIGLTPYALLLT